MYTKRPIECLPGNEGDAGSTLEALTYLLLEPDSRRYIVDVLTNFELSTKLDHLCFVIVKLLGHQANLLL